MNYHISDCKSRIVSTESRMVWNGEKWIPHAEQEESARAAGQPALVVNQPGLEQGDQLQGESHQIQLVHAKPDTNITAATPQFEPLPSPQVALSAEKSVVLLSDIPPDLVAISTAIKTIESGKETTIAVDSGSDMRTLDSTDG